MNLEIRAIHSADADPYPDDLHDFSVSLQVFIGERDR